MEGRRIEGVFLDSQILRNRAQEAYSTARTFQIKVLSSISEALLSSFGDVGGRMRGMVLDVGPAQVKIMLDNGYEITAENRLTIPIKKGDELSMILESKDPLVLRVERSVSSSSPIKELIIKPPVTGYQQLNNAVLQESLENSGIVYEKKVWSFLKGEIPREKLTADLKFNILSSLRSVDPKPLWELISSAKIPLSLKERVQQIGQLVSENRRLEFFTALSKFYAEIDEMVARNRSTLEGMSQSVRTFFEALSKSISEFLIQRGFKLSINSSFLQGMDSQPRSLDLVREAVRNLEEGRFGEFTTKMRFIGITIKNPQDIPPKREEILSQLRTLVDTAVRRVLEEWSAKDIRDLSAKFREVRQETQDLTALRGTYEMFPREVKENLQRLENIFLLQSFVVQQEGKRFLIPFNFDNGGGIAGFSKDREFVIYIKLSYEEGYVGVVITAPRKDIPEQISVVIRTDIEQLRSSLQLGREKLRKDIEDLGISLRNLEIQDVGERDFDSEFMEKFTGGGMLSLRV